MNTRIVGNILGRVLMVEAGFMALPLLCALLCGERAAPFLIPMLLLAVLGLGLWRLRSERRDIYAREGFVCVGAAWVLLSVFGALPFLLSGDIPRPVDALFEAVSGFTTTGASILPAVEGLSRSVSFWRLFTHWIGGMGVLVFIMAMIPASGEHYMHIMRAEVPGPTVNKLVPRIRKTARLLYLIYIALTGAETILLLCGGMSFYDALLHAFATAGTGGFSTRNASIGAFDSAYIEMVVAAFMLLFALNFNVYYLLLLGQLRQVLKSEELRVFLGLVAAATAVIAANIAGRTGGFLRGLRWAFFQVSSIVSTTGFSTADFNAWPELSKWVLVLLMFVGGCAGSTAGGLKLSRVLILIKAYVYEHRRLMLPSRVRRIWFEHRPVEEETVRSVHVFFAAYCMTLLFAGLVLSLDGVDFTTGFTASLACISNVGPGLGAVGPAESYAGFSTLSKLVLCLEMLLGRLEIFPLTYLFSPGVWVRR